MKLSLYGRLSMALFASMVLGLGMTACGGGTIGYLWVLGQQYNQIVGFKIDDFTGNLTETARSPITTNGTNPVSIVVKNGGRYVYVVNQGTAPTTGGGLGTTTNVGSGISVYAVGGDGSLTYENGYSSQGFDPVWAQFDNTGTFLFVLDKYANTSTSACVTAGNCVGSITVFQADPNTGRLTLVQNTQSIPTTGIPPTFFNAGQTPIMMLTAGSCLFTLNSNNTVTPYGINSTTGQLAIEGTGTQPPASGGVQLNSITGNGTYVYFTDADNGGTKPYLYAYSIGANCTLVPVTGGGRNIATDFAGSSNPVYAFVDDTTKYVYVLNQSTTTTAAGTPFSSIVGWTIVPGQNGELQPLVGPPYSTGSGPVCMVEDTSKQYMYISNHNDGTVTGKVFNSTTGALSDLTRGPTFTATGQATCLALSGSVD